MSEQSLDDDWPRIPTPGMQPVRKQAHGVTACETENAANPDHDPGRIRQTTDLAGVYAVADQLQNPLRIPGGLAAKDTVLRTQPSKRRCISALGAELLDSGGKAM